MVFAFSNTLFASVILSVNLIDLVLVNSLE